MVKSKPGADPSAGPTLAEARSAFADTLVARSPRTAANYTSALNRFAEYLESTGADPTTVTVESLADDALERFYAWLLRTYGRDHRPTAVTYLAAVRAFFRFLDRRRWLPADTSYERMRAGLRDLVGRVPYHTPRVDDAVALLVTHVNSVQLPPADSVANQTKRLEILRDRAILNTLFGTALRRAEVAGLNRTDVQDGRATQGIVTGKGSKERIVFFDDASLRAIRAYLAERADGHQPLFIRHDDGRGDPGRNGEHWRLSPQSVWGTVKRYARATEVEATTHHLRHLKARTLLNNGAQLAEVQDILGHASPETTKKIYAPYTTQHLREAFDTFSLSAEEIAKRVEGERAKPPRGTAQRAASGGKKAKPSAAQAADPKT